MFYERRQNRHLECKFEGMTESESADYQLEQWVLGNPIHNPIRDECCPDFSCCVPDLFQPHQKRSEFATAITSGDSGELLEAEKMLMDNLAALIHRDFSDKDVYISGGAASRHINVAEQKHETFQKVYAKDEVLKVEFKTRN